MRTKICNHYVVTEKFPVIKFNQGFIILIMIIFIILGCNDKEKRAYKTEKIDHKVINVLRNMKVYFGHKSVGYNIIRGIEDLETGIHVQELGSGQLLITPGIYHGENGKNSFPKSKIDAFKIRLKENDLGNKLDIAFFKFCFVDFKTDSDVVEIFNYYIDAVESTKKEFPKLKIVHVTVPLMAPTYGIKNFIKNLLFGDGDIPNVKRNQFNSLLIDKYKDKDPIYDLAMIESKYPDGKREVFKYQGNLYYSLIKDYTYDGGHLNEKGRYLAANALLKLLSEIKRN